MMTSDWSTLPDHIVSRIFSHFTSCEEKLQSLQVCRGWRASALANPRKLWTANQFCFQETPIEPKTELCCVQEYGDLMYSVAISVDQKEPYVRLRALKFIKLISEKAQSLSSIKLQFTNQNPLFYGGEEFVTALEGLFSSFTNGPRLTNVDLSGLPVKLSNELMFSLSHHHGETLQEINIQNSQMICMVHSECMAHVVARCKKLRKLHVYYASLDDTVLQWFTQKDRTKIEYISVLCSGQDKYRSEKIGLTVDICRESWLELANACPGVMIAFKFDHRVPEPRISEILSQTPIIHELKLETYTILHREI